MGLHFSGQHNHTTQKYSPSGVSVGCEIDLRRKKVTRMLFLSAVSLRMENVFIREHSLNFGKIFWQKLLRPSNFSKFVRVIVLILIFINFICCHRIFLNPFSGQNKEDIGIRQVYNVSLVCT